MPCFVTCHKQYLVEKDDHKRNEIIKQLYQLLWNKLMQQKVRFVNMSNNEKAVQMIMGSFRLVFAK